MEPVGMQSDGARRDAMRWNSNARKVDPEELEYEESVMLDARLEEAKVNLYASQNSLERSRSPNHLSEAMLDWLESDFKNDLAELLQKLKDFISRNEKLGIEEFGWRNEMRDAKENGFKTYQKSVARDNLGSGIVSLADDETAPLNEFHTEETPCSNEGTPRSLSTEVPPSISQTWHRAKTKTGLEDFRHNLRKAATDNLSMKTSILRHHPLRELWQFLEDPESSHIAMIYSRVMQAIVVFSVFFALIQTVDPPPFNGKDAAVLETSIDGLYCLEFVLRFVACPNKKFFFFHLFDLLDLLAALVIIPRICVGFNLNNVEEGAGRTFLLCYVPLIRMTKTLRRFQKLHLVIKAFELAIEALPVLLWTMVVAVLFFSTAIYICEPRDNIEHLPKAMWLTIVTMTTVGYGDVSPVSVPGTLVTSVVIVASVLYMAMPLGIIGETFGQVWKDRDRILLMQQTRKRLMEWGYNAIDIPIIFSLFDEDGTGEVELPEFRQMVREMGIGLKEERVIELFASLDRDGGGGISDKEFVKEIFPNSFYKLFCVDVAPAKNLRSKGTKLFSAVEGAKDLGRMSIVARKSFASRITTGSSAIGTRDEPPQPFARRALSDESTQLRPRVYFEESLKECSDGFAPPPEISNSPRPPDPGEQIVMDNEKPAGARRTAVAWD